MTEQRIKFNNVVQNQLPSYVREEFPLISEFLKQYYISQEFQGAPVDLIQNIDRYIKLNQTTSLTESVILSSDITEFESTISVDLTQSPSGTVGFPDSYGILKIDDEIITYTGKTTSSFTGCVRGFSGISSYRKEANPEELVFDSTLAAQHVSGSKIENLSILFLKEFLIKTKNQFLPGLNERELVDGLNENVFIKQAKDFYLSKGTDRSFEILFKSLFNEEAKIVKPRDFLFTPSDGRYRITNDFVVESLEGDPMDLQDSTLYQDEYGETITKAYAPITSVEKVISGLGVTYYKLSIDSGYDRDIDVDGSIYGDFSIHPKTKLIGGVSSGSTIFDVDSTLGFPTSGELVVSFNDASLGIVSYTSKSLTQFYGCSNVTKDILDTTTVGINTYARGISFSNPNETIKVRLRSVLNSLDYPNTTHYYSPKDTTRIKTLGSNASDFKSKNWVLNIAPIFQIKSISLIDSTDQTYRVVLTKDHPFRIGDSATIIGSDNSSKSTKVIEVTTSDTFIIKGQGELNLTYNYKIKKIIQRALSNKFPKISSYTSNVQNIYNDQNKILVASASLPFYDGQPLDTTDRSITFSGTFIGTEFVITSNSDHGFYTGDAVYYIPEKINQQYFDNDVLKTELVVNSSLFSEGLYYVRRISSTTIKLAKSKTNLYNSKFVSVDSQTTVTNNIIQPYEFRFKSLQSQKVLREVSDPINDGSLHETTPGFTGILINGVEVSNYKSSDTVYYGKLNEIEVLSPGSEYDIINPPLLSIVDSVGTGATGYVAVSGSLQEIRVLDSGFDYVETPTIRISGGNGNGAVALPSMKLIDHSVLFNSESSSENAGVGTTTSTIGFGTYHKFRNAEQVIYDPISQKAVGGITTNASYFVSVQSDYIVKLHKTRDDAIAGINTVKLSATGTGKHSIRSYNKKSVLESIQVVSSGSGYQNKQRTAGVSGVSTSYSQITIANHEYSSGEIIKYTTSDTVIGGLTNGSEYYVTKVDNDSFKLSVVGVGTANKDFYYSTRQYIEFTSVGVGTHTFNYPDIAVTIDGKIGISSIGTETFAARVQPIFRGSVTSIHLSNSGVGYGSSEIINLDRQPQISLVSGQDAQLAPVINNGKIIEVIVLNSGKKYNSPPNLIITGDGSGAVVTPVLSNGLITSVKIVESGGGYSQQNTSISVVFPGVGAQFRTKIQSWTVNLFGKNFANFTGDDGFITTGLDEVKELQYSHIFAPRKLREILYSVDQSGKILYGNKDLPKANNLEISPTNHSPIIGWSYDGHPIYGPYGYATRSGGIVTQLKSGYKLNIGTNRPSISNFPEGFFVEDYTHYKVSDESVLDENNGRFCITPEYPNGTYAYFATFESLLDSSGPFTGYKRPAFPYLIGKSFKSVPNKFNFDYKSNQDHIDLNKTRWLRNTEQYNLIDGTVVYEYLTLPNNLNQTLDISAVSPGFVENIGIITGGINYKVNDSVVFDELDTQGFGAIAKVSRIFGKSVNSVSVATSTISSVEIYPSNDKGDYTVFCNNPHNFKNGDVISITGLSTTSSEIEGFYTAGVSTNTLSVSGVGTVSLGIGTIGATGIVTYFRVSGSLGLQNIRENDILGIGTENVKVLNVEPEFSRIRVLRAINGTVGSSHTVTTILYEKSRRLNVNSGFKTTYDYRVNKEIYFKPSESVGLGVGIGSTLFLSNPGAGISQIFIPTKSIYIKNHGLETGDLLTYSPNSGSAIIILENGVGIGTTLKDQQNIFVAKISNDLIGLSTVRVGLGSTGTFVGIASTAFGSTLMAFTGIGTGEYHSFKTNHTVITAKLIRNLVTVSTAETHGLSSGHDVYVDVNPSISTTYTVTYNDYHRKLLINSKSFTSVGINTISDSITIVDHGYKTGDKVIHTSSTPSQGLDNNKIYYIVKIDGDTFKLSNTYYESLNTKPSTVGIASTSSGTLSLVNPSLEVYGNSSIIFDLSDSSLSYVNQSTRYPAFEFNFYLDENYTDPYFKNIKGISFNVQKSGKIGVDTGAKVTLIIDDDAPKKLFYKLTPVAESDIPLEKSEINVDNSVVSNNEIIIKESLYNGKHSVSVASTNSFTYSLEKTPEKVSYTTSNARLSYETDCTHAYGAITKIDILDKGRNYYSLPGISTINSLIGKGAIIEASSKSIGKIKKTQINDIGFDFPSDNTVRPNAALPQIIKIDSLASFDFVGVSSFGRGYNSAPKLLVFDGKTNKLMNDVDLKYELGNTKVEILKNTFGISNTKPIILPIQNSNGVGISSVGFNTSTNDVTITLSVGFSTADSFPFKVNDRVLIENVSVGVGSTAKGYNSDAYGYQLFTLTDVKENRGGIGSVTYNLSDYLVTEENPGKFDAINSSGRIIPEKYFPLFNVSLKTIDFIEGETVSSESSVGIVEKWDEKNGILKISSNESFKANEVLVGKTSNTQGIAASITSFDSSFNLSPYSKVIKGWQSNSGFLNDNLQRIQDSFYYQNFSYSIKSRVSYDTWNDAVSSLNHTVGFRKFSDYQLESTLPNSNKNSMVVGVSTDLTSFEVIGDFTGVANLNCVYDFDLVTENSLTQGSTFLSDEIVFASRVLTDYFESFGNRVLSIDDISGQFNSNPRATAYNIVNTFKLADVRAQKYFAYIKDTRFEAQRQLMAISLVHDGTFAYINQYGRTETVYDLGSFDFIVSGTDGELTFYPTKYALNDYQLSLISYNLDDNLLSIGSTNIGGIIDIKTTSKSTIGAASTSIISIGTTYRSVKALVEITGSGNEYEFDELNIIHDGSEVYITEYGQVTTNPGFFGISGFGTYNPYISGSNLIVDFIPNAGVAATINTIQVAITSEGTSGIGTVDLKHARLEARTTTIASSGTPGIHTIGRYPDDYDAAYFIVQVSDTTNSRHQMSEVFVVDDYISSLGSGDTFDNEFGTVETVTGLGTIGSRIIGASSGIGTVELVFTPIASINATVKVYMNALRIQDDNKDQISFNNATIRTGFGNYEGTEKSIRRAFDLRHKNDPIFAKEFVGSASSIVSVSSNTIRLPNHFFVTGESVKYIHAGAGTTQSIGIGTTTFVGVGSTDKLPENIFIVKVNDDSVKLASSAENALKIVPDTLDITHVGIGTSHRFIAKNQNAKALLALDNIIQSPVVATSVTTTLADQVFTTDDLIKFSGITSFFGSDLIKVGDEIMKIEGVGIGSTNVIRVRRTWLGTSLAGYSTGTLVTKVIGNYNIVENTLNFVEAPYGNTPLGTSTNPPDERDWTGISTGSHFQGRTFMRSGVTNTTNETYYKNYIFDDISSGFNGNERTFYLKSNKSDVTGIATENAIILINDVFQGPGLSYDYNLTENSGITSIRFTGTATSISSDPNTSNLPLGGVVLSVGSTEGFGYQPLVAAGGTAIVSIAGTISSISIGNSGSGYRAGIQTSVRVAVQTSSTRTPNLHFIGTAAISNGHIVSVAITNPGSGYTATNPPVVVFDYPLSYSDIPLRYSSDSTSGIGTGATIDVVVGQGSSVIDFEIKNTGYGYGNGETLTVPIGGLTGIPTTSSFQEFRVTIQNTFTDEFTGWSLGTLQVLDSVEELFDGETRTFPLKVAGNLVSIRSSRGSKINVQDVLLVFVNDILQVPGEGYTFTGGSIITFSEAPKVGDRCRVIFYKGSGDVDVVFRNIIETVKIGDELTIGYDIDANQQPTLQEDPRTVTSVDSTDIVSTMPYFGPGNTDNESLLRPVVWCRQTEDRIINEKEIGKDRELYEPVINPFAYIISSVGIGSTNIYVDSIRPFFNPQNENDTSLTFQKKVKFVSQDEKVSAAATAIVSAAGTIQSVAISTGGVGYSTTPTVTIGNPNTVTATATAKLSDSDTTVSNVTVTNVGSGYTIAPIVTFSSPENGTTATGTAVINSGSVTSITITNAGVGYTLGAPTVTIAEPTRVQSTATATVSAGGTISAIAISIAGAGYTSSIIPKVLISPPPVIDEENGVETYSGDHGIIVGFGTTTISSQTQLRFDLYIPPSSFMRDVTVVGSAVTISGISTGDYFIVSNTNIGTALTALDSSGSIVGIGTSFLDNVYYVDNHQIIQSPTGIGSDGVGIGTTHVKRVFVRVSNNFAYSGILTSGYFGDYSWGKIVLSSRSGINSYTAHTSNGVIGITTSMRVQRFESLKFKNYLN